MNKYIIIVLIIVSMFIFCFSNIIVEGLTPGSTLSPSTSQGNSNNPLSTTSALDRFASALVSAFSPPSTTSSQPTIAKPAWMNVKELADPATVISNSPAGCKSKIQVAVDPLPVDVQAQSTIVSHSETIIRTLDAYELQLKKLEDILNKPKNILALNKNVESVPNLGVPSVSVVYDENSNSLINISVVKGIAGDKGDKPNPISGIPVRGDIGDAGVDGINPIGKSMETLPYWAKK